MTWLARLAVLHQFYASREWQAFRAAIIAERGMTCQHCHRLITGIRDLTLHHITELTPNNVHDAMVALNPDNVLIVHHDCHDAIHKRFGHQCKDGVYIVYGMPLSGKSTYVAQMMRRGDIVIDMNMLYEAITGMPEYDKPDSLLPNVRAVHNLLIDQVKTRYGKWGSAWVMGGYPEKFQRERLADELGAELVYCACTKADALTRLELDERRRNLRAEYTRYIDTWLERYTA